MNEQIYDGLSIDDMADIEEALAGYAEPEEIVPESTGVNYHNITHDDMLNGDGLRAVMWFAGCSHHCKECQNPITWDPDGGIPLTAWEEAEFWEWLNKPWTQGATFSGGDPLHPRNREYAGKMMERVKATPGKDVWVYTGYDLKYTDADGFFFQDAEGNTFKYPYLKHIDVLVDGRFECQTRRADIESGKQVIWRGSSNQRVIDVQESLKGHCIVLKYL